MAIKRTRKQRPRKYFTSGELKKYIPLFDRNGVGGGNLPSYLQNIKFNPDTLKFFDQGLYGQTGGLITNNQVPVAASNGIDDGIILAENLLIENGESISFLFKNNALADGNYRRLFYNFLSSPTRYCGLYFSISNAKVITLQVVKSDNSGYLSGSYIFSTDFPSSDFIELKLRVDGNSILINRSDTNESVSCDFGEPVYMNLGYLFQNNSGSQNFSCEFLCLKKNGALLALFQHNSGDNLYKVNGSILGTWQGSGTRYTRVDNIPNPHQAADIKRVTHDNGTAYIPATVSDAEILANYSNASIELLSGMYKDDGSRLNLHASENETELSSGVTISDKLREVNAPTAYQAGTDQANYVVNYEAGKVTNSMKLKS